MIVKDSIKELLGLETELSEIEYSKHGLKRHLEKRKHYDVLKYIDNIRDNIAKILEIDSELINVKAKTEEKLGFTGDETGVKSYCVVLLEKEKC